MTIKLLDRKTLLEYKEEPITDGVVRKQFVAEIKGMDDDDDNSRKVQFTISTGDRDREGDIIDPKGWELENYLRNPVVLFAHDSRRPPVGRAIEVNLHDDRLVAVAEFMPPDVDISGFSETIYRMVKSGYLNATSVGFLPKEWKLIKEKLGEDEDSDLVVTGIHFLKHELLEFSVVPIPANPNALIGASKSGIDIHPLEQWFEEALDQWSQYKDIVALPRKDVEELYKITRGLLIRPRHAEPKEKTVITWSSAHPNGTMVADRNASWDGPAEIRRADVQDLMVMCAWREDKPRDELVKGDFKLPHHRASDKAVVWRGVVAAMAALLGARGGVNIPDSERRGVYRHLARHYREDFDEEPPSFSMVEQQILRSEEYEMDFETGQVIKVEEMSMGQSQDLVDVKDMDEEDEDRNQSGMGGNNDDDDDKKQMDDPGHEDMSEMDHSMYVFHLAVGTVQVRLCAPSMSDLSDMIRFSYEMLDRISSASAGSIESSDGGGETKNQDDSSAVSGDRDAKAQDKAQTAQPERRDASDDLPEDILEDLYKELPSLIRETVESEIGKLRGRVN